MAMGTAGRLSALREGLTEETQTPAAPSAAASQGEALPRRERRRATSVLEVRSTCLALQLLSFRQPSQTQQLLRTACTEPLYTQRPLLDTGGVAG